MSKDLVRQIRVRVRDNPLGPALQRYITYLVSRGYSETTWSEFVRVAEHFGCWLGRRSLSQVTVRQFLCQHLSACQCSTPVRENGGCCSGPVIRSWKRNQRALKHLLAMLGITRSVAAEFPSGIVGDVLRRYAKWLKNARGLAAGTIRYRLKTAKTMLTSFRIKRAGQLAKWTPRLIVDFMSGEAARGTPSRAQQIACGVRSLLRFLLQEGLICHDLSAAVPTFAHWRLAPLPEILQKEELAQLLKQPNTRNAMGLRNRAILLCLNELGLRASDVAGIELAGVDFASGLLTIRRSKQRKSTVLPMPRKLAHALKAYLQRGRPACKSPMLFVHHWPPVGTAIKSSTVSQIVWSLGERAKLRPQVRGAHVLRHTFASRMLGAGATLKEVADLLGHKSIDTTAIYAKVDIKALTHVALPWPGAKESRQ